MFTDLKKDTYIRNVEKLTNEIDQACKLSGRNPDDILIVAASKYVSFFKSVIIFLIIYL